MLKRLALIFGLLALSIAPAFAAGTINLSLSQQFDSQGRPLAGGKLYFYTAGTSTPQSAYQDSALTIAYPNPIELTSAGRVPPFFLADGTIKVRLDDVSGVTVLSYDDLQVVGPSSGSGGGGTVDATTVLATGDVKARFATGTLSGFVRMNGRTIGSATSGATERANADTQALFLLLWSADTRLTVSGGRGANAAADWASNKRLTLPDMRGRVLAGLDDMGNSAASVLTTTYYGDDPTVLGTWGGSQSHTLTVAQMPAHDHTASATSSVTDPGHTHAYTEWGGTNAKTSGSGSAPPVSSSTGATSSSTTGISVSTSVTVDDAGGDDPHPIIQPSMTITFYMKL